VHARRKTPAISRKRGRKLRERTLVLADDARILQNRSHIA